VLGLAPGESVDVAEPFGVIRGVGLATDSRRVRILLNASVAPSASPRGPAPAGSGGVVDAVALACDDIFTTVARLRDNGVTFVPISGNYYDDLAARQVLEESVIDRMRSQDIVFDRSSSGTYFQAYTEAFEGRFHFQIVQRTGYDGYGAVNEPLRAAALEQMRQVEEWLQPRL
jgi:4-hydroxyphenylpyruvate dioxygenase